MVWHFLNQVKHVYDSAIPQENIYSKEIKTYPQNRDLYSMPIAALFIILIILAHHLIVYYSAVQSKILMKRASVNLKKKMISKSIDSIWGLYIALYIYSIVYIYKVYTVHMGLDEVSNQIKLIMAIEIKGGCFCDDGREIAKQFEKTF